MTTAAPFTAAPVVSHPAAQRWIFSRATDLAVFGGSAALAFVMLAAGYLAGLTQRPFPAWAWVATILFIDVAHVWTTIYRVYLDPAEVRRRPRLYLGVPAAAYTAGVLLYAIGPRVFWSTLAYLAVFHFVRQQYGWVAIYKRRNHDRARVDNWLDSIAIYNATVYPILWWHGHLPRSFEWLIQGDFLAGFPTALADALHPLHIAVMVLWAARQVWVFRTTRRINAGKILVVISTWLCWYVGIVLTQSDYAFTVTNVIVHGVPYIALTWRFASNRYRPQLRGGSAGSVARWLVRLGFPAFFGFAVLLAVCEEGLWDLLVWHERSYLFGAFDLELPAALLAVVVPALAMPQAAHYALDGWIWRTGRGNPTLLRDLGWEQTEARPRVAP